MNARASQAQQVGEPQDEGAELSAEGARDGVDIRVVVEKDGSRIVTGFPTNVPRNP